MLSWKVKGFKICVYQKLKGDWWGITKDAEYIINNQSKT